MTTPLYFDEFFASGKEETISPFLTPDSRKWGKSLSLRASFLSAFCLALSFAFSFFSPPLSHLFLIFVYFLSGTTAFISSLHDIRKFEINIDVLMTLAALLSVLIGSGLEGGLLLVLFEISAAMEETVTHKTRGTLVSLHDLSPRAAYVIGDDGHLYEKAVRDITVGTLLLIKAGEIIPLDGEVTEGSSLVNLVHLTGESQPLSKKKGDEVPAGAGNLDGTLTIRVIRTSTDSTLSRIIKLITQAQAAKPQLQQFLDRFGKWYASTIILLSTLFAFTLPWIFHIPYLGIEGSIYRALTFLIAASPCALIIAVPTAYLGAISSCAKKGILLKGGITLDGVTQCKVVAFDKTGTLTTGKLTCTSFEQVSGPPFNPDTALSIAATLERHAVHPIGEALTLYAQKQGLSPSPIEDFKSIAGSGLEGLILNHSAAIGHKDFILSKMTTPPTLPSSSQLVTYLLADQSLFAFHFTDQMRPAIQNVILSLKQRHLQIVMLSGDHIINAQTVAQQLGIDEVYADLRPEDKLAKVSELSQTKGLMMIGDGINDAPALARATIGISMGKIGSMAAVDASDIVFLNDDLNLLDWLYKKAHQTTRIVKQNLILALGVICCVTTPALLGWVPLWLAVILHEGGTVLVGLNSLRLLRS
jgi:heavy metal translocating P-type ATPase